MLNYHTTLVETSHPKLTTKFCIDIVEHKSEKQKRLQQISKSILLPNH